MNLGVVIVLAVCVGIQTVSSAFTCTNKVDGMYSNVDDPHTFWYCSNGNSALLTCPHNLVWSQEQLQCDWQSDTTSSSTTTPLTTTITPAPLTTTTPSPLITPVSACPSNGRLLQFDDISATSAWARLPNGYGGFQWTNSCYTNGPNAETGSGFRSAVTSGKYAAFNADGARMIMIINAAKSFNLYSFMATSVWNNDLTLQIKGKRSGITKYTEHVILQVASPAKRIVLNWTDVEIVEFITFGGTPQPGLKGSGTHFAFDDMCISFNK
ncbi:unnamed protein product [Didymodactylos carnosus]|uniref:Chitin-binding type-2 domain-containing protein n=1 Tax=Didymodactylos carnosus TaxID=1234261 RepID=A0A814KJL6_9BILA|nr:unnamed protein product [Didymodactylos carnosus]CAF3821523.1 unnamed protein product [Didymodactylos carnosus]